MTILQATSFQKINAQGLGSPRLIAISSEADSTVSSSAITYLRRQWHGYIKDKHHDNNEIAIALLTLCVLILQWLTYRKQAQFPARQLSGLMEVERAWIRPDGINL